MKAVWSALLDEIGSIFPQDKHKYRKFWNGMKPTTKELTPKGFAIPTDLSRNQTTVCRKSVGHASLWRIEAYL
jgi:hypothetical protein